MSDKKLCWIDLETTGSALATSQILEIGIAITDDEGNIQAEKSWLNPAGMDSLRVVNVDPVVIEMHATSGLWRDLQKVYRDPLDLLPDPLNRLGARAQVNPTLAGLDREISSWLLLQNDHRTEHMALAGSGVSHFDRGFIRRDLPSVDKMLTYWAYDVGVVRRMLRLVGLNSQSEDAMPNHRALDDVKAHITEFRQQLTMLKAIHQGAVVTVPTGVRYEPLFPGRNGTELVEGGVS